MSRGATTGNRDHRTSSVAHSWNREWEREQERDRDSGRSGGSGGSGGGRDRGGVRGSVRIRERERAIMNPWGNEANRREKPMPMPGSISDDRWRGWRLRPTG
mgnify:CR=1 FL=1